MHNPIPWAQKSKGPTYYTDDGDLEPFGFRMNDIIRTPLGCQGTVIGVKWVHRFSVDKHLKVPMHACCVSSASDASPWRWRSKAFHGTCALTHQSSLVPWVWCRYEDPAQKETGRAWVRYENGNEAPLEPRLGAGLMSALGWGLGAAFVLDMAIISNLT